MRNAIPTGMRTARSGGTTLCWLFGTNEEVEVEVQVIVDWASEAVGGDVDFDVDIILPEGRIDDAGRTREVDDDCERVSELEVRESEFDEDITFVIWVVCPSDIDSDNDADPEIEIWDVGRVDPP